MQARDPLPPADATTRDETRARILAAAAQLIEQGGRDAATTRAVAAAAGVQAPTIYRLFGDKRGLLDAVAMERLNAYIAGKSTRPADPDPVQDLRDGWDMHIAFGLANPGVFGILSSDPQPGPGSQAVAQGLSVLRERVRRIALAGRLRTSEERAVGLLRSAGTGTVLTLLGQPEGARDEGLSKAAREAVLAAIVQAPLPSTPNAQEAPDAPAAGAAHGHAAAAALLRASLDQVAVLSAGERHLLTELLDRIAQAG